MALNFPTSPADGQQYAYGGQTYQYDLANTTWKLLVSLIQPTLLSPRETMTFNASPAAANVNFDVLTQGILYYTSNATGLWTLNIRGSSTTRLDQAIANGQSFTVTFMANIGSTTYYQQTLQIDGVGVNARWLNGITPANNTANTVDTYTYSVMKQSPNTYVVLASISSFT